MRACDCTSLSHVLIFSRCDTSNDTTHHGLSQKYIKSIKNNVYELNNYIFSHKPKFPKTWIFFPKLMLSRNPHLDWWRWLKIGDKMMMLQGFSPSSKFSPSSLPLSILSLISYWLLLSFVTNKGKVRKEKLEESILWRYISLKG